MHQHQEQVKRATVNTGRFTHPNFRTGDKVYVKDNGDQVCRIAKTKDGPFDQNFRREMLDFGVKDES